MTVLRAGEKTDVSARAHRLPRVTMRMTSIAHLLLMFTASSASVCKRLARECSYISDIAARLREKHAPPTFVLTLPLPPSPVPIFEPTPLPIPEPTFAPTPQPSPLPTLQPTPVPTLNPTSMPSPVPTLQPTSLPTLLPTSVPSLVPTLVPTPAPTVSPVPTSLPSQVPTVFICSFTEDGDFDPTAYLAFAKLKIEVETASSAFALAPVDNADAVFSRGFSLMSSVEPGSSLAFTASLADGTAIGDTGSSMVQTAADHAAKVSVVVKTSTIYHDERTVEVAYQLFDTTLRTAVLRQNLVVTLNAVLGVKIKSSNCGNPDSTSGVGLCVISVASSWFSTVSDQTASVTLNVKYGGTTFASSETVSISLAKQPTFDALSAAGMYATMPHHPLLVGDTFAVPVYAHTGGQDLSVSSSHTALVFSLTRA